MYGGVVFCEFFEIKDCDFEFEEEVFISESLFFIFCIIIVMCNV